MRAVRRRDRRVGRDLNERIASVPIASSEEMTKMAEQLWQALDGRGWYVMFKHMDEDGSGTLDRREIRDALDRMGVALSKRELIEVMEFFGCG